MTEHPEKIPSGTFGGARARRIPAEREHRIEAARHFAELAAEVAAIDGARRRARTAAPSSQQTEIRTAA